MISDARCRTGAWDERIARARQLADVTPAAADVLAFYAALAEHQKGLLTGSGGGAITSDERPLLDLLDTEAVVEAVRSLVSWLSRAGPRGLSEPMRAMRELTVQDWREILEAYRCASADPASRLEETTLFVLEAALQPFAEHVASSRAERASGERWCPMCGGAPVLGVLREEGHGARRALLCGLCLTQWDYLRLVCPECGEQKFESLPVFTADQFPHVRIEACDTCRTYLKTIDLTKDGRAVPVVDDIASVSLDLWARNQGYTRLRANLVRT